MSTQREQVASMTSAARAGLRALKAIFAGGLIGGAFDITYACAVWAFRGTSPIRVGQSVASGLLGRDAAVAGGVPAGLLGFALHFGMALVMAAVYYAAATRIPLLVKRAAWCGPIYGLGLYLTMNYIVLPLSAIGRHGGNGPLYLVIPEILVHMFLVGLTIALFTRSALRTD
ncbi:MAG: hypothetical protein WDO68_14920 [Gammaproteobacteria bacterium]